MIYTYEGIKTAIKDRLSLMSQWNKILYFGVYERIIDIIAYTADKLVYLAEFLYKESKWFTATTRQSLVIMGRWLSYIPYRKTGATGNLSLSADPTFNPLYPYVGKNVTIRKWHRFTDEGNSLNTFCTEDTNYLTGQEGSITIPIKEGEPKQFLYVANGEISEEIKIYSSNIDNDIIEIEIVDSNNSKLYDVEIVNNLYLVFDTTSYTCEIKNSSNNEFITIVFGDGINARKLAIGERVLVKYADTLGIDGNITSTNIITKSKDLFYDEDGAITTLYITNDNAITGGSEIEPIESIRNNAPNLFQVGMILSGLQNWESAINSAPFVSKSKIWSVEALGGSTEVSEQNIVYVSVVSNIGEDLTPSQQTNLLTNYIIPKKPLTEVVEFFPLQKIYARFDITARIQNKPISIMDEEIKTVLNNNYSIFNVEFQQNIYESNFYSKIDQISDVLWHETQIYYLEKNIDSLVSNFVLLPSFTSTDTSILEQQQWLIEDSFEIWLRRKIAGEWENPLQIGYSSSVNIIGMNGFNIINGFLVYSSNQYSFNITEITNDDGTIYGVQNPGDSDELGYLIYISYKMKDGDDKQVNTIRLPRFYQIVDIDNAFIDTDLTYSV